MAPELDLDDMFFQQEGATCHTSCGTIDLFKEKFPQIGIEETNGGWG